MVETLRDAGVLLEAKQTTITTGSIRWPGAGGSVTCFTTSPATAAGGASSAEIGGSAGAAGDGESDSGGGSGVAWHHNQEAQLR